MSVYDCVGYVLRSTGKSSCLRIFCVKGTLGGVCKPEIARAIVMDRSGLRTNELFGLASFEIVMSWSVARSA